MIPEGPYQPEASAIGRRSLAITALAYLAKIEQVDTILEDLFNNALNLTERFAAYRLARSDAAPELSDALSQKFLEEADTDEVLDLWLSTEATNERTATVERVRELTEHDRFAWTNPNRVRAVLGAFANRNVCLLYTSPSPRDGT